MKKYLLISLLMIVSALCTIGNAQDLQKIKFQNFQIENAKDKVSIRWSIDKEVPTNYFELEKSIDGVHFKTIAFVLGPDPASGGNEIYRCFDKVSSIKKATYYRLKLVSVDGKEDFSDVQIFALNK